MVGKVRTIDATSSIENVFADSKRSLAPEVTFLFGPPSSYKSEIASALESCQNYKHVNVDEFTNSKMSDQEIVTLVVDFLVKNQNS